MKKKCATCGEVKSLTDFSKNKNYKDGHAYNCKKCKNEIVTQYRNTEIGYLKMRYDSLKRREFLKTRYGRRSKCHFTLDALLTAFEKHKSIHGMRSVWGPGIDHLEQHLPITMIQEGNGKIGTHGGCLKGSKRIRSNLSIDRLDPNIGYTLQNIIFLRYDENARKKDTTYNDCLIQIKLHDERFIKMKAI